MFEGLKKQVGLLLSLLDEATNQLQIFETRQAETFSNTARAQDIAKRQLESLGDSVDKTTQRVEQRMAEVQTRASETKRAVEQDLTTLSERTEQARDRTASALSDLVDRLSEARNDWDKEIQFGLDALRAGLIDFEDFIRRYGDAVIEVEGKNKRLKDLLAGTEREIENRLQNILRQIRDRSASLEDIVQSVGELGGRFAELVVAMVRKFEEGGVTLNELRRQLEGLVRDFPGAEGSDFDSIVEDLLERLEQEERDGLI